MRSLCRRLDSCPLAAYAMHCHVTPCLAMPWQCSVCMPCDAQQCVVLQCLQCRITHKGPRSDFAFTPLPLSVVMRGMVRTLQPCGCSLWCCTLGFVVGILLQCGLVYYMLCLLLHLAARCPAMLALGSHSRAAARVTLSNTLYVYVKDIVNIGCCAHVVRA